MTVGGRGHSKSTLVCWLKKSVCEDASIALFQQVVAAKLNLAQGCCVSSAVKDAIKKADAWLCAHPVGSHLSANSSAWSSIGAAYSALDRFNNNRLEGKGKREEGRGAGSLLPSSLLTSLSNRAWGSCVVNPMSKNDVRSTTERSAERAQSGLVASSIEAIAAGVLTPEGSLALDGGHLAGNKDQLNAGRKTHGHASPVPGASGQAPEEDAGFTPQEPQPKATGGVPPVQGLRPEEVQEDF